MTDEQKKSIRENVLAAIDAGQVKMRPRWHFVAKAALLLTGTILATLVLLYLASFTVFILHQNGAWFAPGFGLRGVRGALVELPWLLLLIVLVFVGVLQILVKKFSFSYGRPLLYSAIGIVFFALAGGFLLSLTPVHRGLYMQAQENRLPFAGKLYRQYGMPNGSGNITPGEITEITPAGYKILTPRSEVLYIAISPETEIFPKVEFQIGNKIIVAGQRQGNQIDAYGIRKITDEIIFFPRGYRQKSGSGFPPTQ